MLKILNFILAGLLALPLLSFAAPENFEQAKEMSKRHVYADRTNAGTFYCGCSWRWTGKSGGRVDLNSCNYQVRKDQNRAERLEWEHIVPASNFGRARQCWQKGGRENCNRTDPVFNAMEADLHNLTPSIGEVNGDRSNFDFGMLPQTRANYGECPTKVDFKLKTAEPRDAVKGQVARTYFYMFDRYNLRMSRQQQQLMIAWNKQFPVSEWERVRNKRVAAVMGHENPFVTGEKTWSLNHENEGAAASSHSYQRQFTEQKVRTIAPDQAFDGAIRGNKKSKVYHLPAGCPSYESVNPQNIVEFSSESEALSAGYRKAGNCR